MFAKRFLMVILLFIFNKFSHANLVNVKNLNIKLLSERQIENFSPKQIGNLSAFDFVFIKSEMVNDVTYSYYYFQKNGIPLYPSQLILIWDNNYNLCFANVNLDHSDNKNFESLIGAWPSNLQSNEKIIYYYYENEWLLSILKNENISENVVTNIRSLENNHILFEKGNAQFVNKDSLVHTSLFNPDPLTKGHLKYSTSGIEDFNDSSYSAIENLKSLVQFKLIYNTDSNYFISESPHVVLKELGGPVDTFVNYFTNTYNFTRNQMQFENMMLFNHIEKMHEHLSTLGFTALQNSRTQCDAHAMYSDNSMFTPPSGTGTDTLGKLWFGIGGIDDAEDADVIIHEYTHAINFAISNLLASSFVNEKRGLDEGVADYIAMSYSNSIDTFDWSKLFSWDGNQTWNGRKAISNFKYTDLNVNGNIYTIGGVWCDVMQGLYFDLGRNISDKLQFQSMYAYTSNTTLPDAAKILLMTDSLLYGGIHSDVICKHVTRKFVLDSCRQYIASIKDSRPSNDKIKILNTHGFATSNEPLLISFDQNYKIIICTLYDMCGKRISQRLYENLSELKYSFDNCQGVFLLKIDFDNFFFTTKIYRN